MLMKRSALLLIVPLVLVGCQTSTRSIVLKQGTFNVERPRFVEDNFAFSFSPDGAKALTFSGNGSDMVSRVLDRDSGTVLAEYATGEDGWFPILFCEDGASLVFVLNQGGKNQVAMAPIGKLPADDANREWREFNISRPNNDWSLWAGSGGDVLTRAGGVVHIEGATGEPLFDQFGRVWFRARGGWICIDKLGAVTTGDRPAYLVSDPEARRGSMRLIETKETLTYENAEADVSAIWIHHDAALGGLDEHRHPRNLSALIHSGEDVHWFAFVPGRDEVMVAKDTGTVYVPFTIDRE